MVSRILLVWQGRISTDDANILLSVAAVIFELGDEILKFRAHSETQRDSCGNKISQLAALEQARTNRAV